MFNDLNISTINTFLHNRLLKCYHYSTMGTRIIKGKYIQVAVIVFQNSPTYILRFRVEILELNIVFIQFVLWSGKRPLITLYDYVNVYIWVNCLCSFLCTHDSIVVLSQKINTCNILETWRGGGNCYMCTP